MNSSEERQLEYIEKCMTLISEWSERKGKNITYSVVTFGCQMNARDSEKLKGILEETGCVGTSEDEADILLFNTCTVRDNADRKVYGRLGTLKEVKKQRPDMVIGVCGCMTQEAVAAEKIKKTCPHVDIIFGTHNVYTLAELLYRHLSEKTLTVDIWDEAKEVAEHLPVRRKYPFKSGVNISYGCNNFCTYCIVPYVRGRERSRLSSDILDEVRRLSKEGVTEIMLLGQNVNSYGHDLKDEDRMTFAALLKAVADTEGIERVRFMTSHPKDLSDELIDTIASHPKICNHVHLPLQSGSSRLLKDMNRRYDKEHYLELVRKLREKIPDVAITTDIIVGYPGETDEDNEETLDVIRRAEFDNAFTFQYSKRTGTPAASRPDQIPQEVVTRRFNKVLALVQEMSRKRAMLLEGKTLPVLVEDVNEREEGLVTGRLENNMSVHFKGDASLIGKYVDVVLTECKGFYYIGEIKNV